MTIAVDGSALDNPGPAGWAWYIDEDNWAADGWKHGTNNQGELLSVLNALKATADSGANIHFLADSQYVINSITKWMPGWKAKGWTRGKNQPVKNLDIIKELDELLAEAKDAGRSITFEWVKGHSNHPLNEKVDDLARGAAESIKAGSPVSQGPGFTMNTVGAGSTQEVAPEQASSASADDAVDEERITVHTPLEKSLADFIVTRARENRRTAPEELAELIRLGVKSRYGFPQQD